MTSTAAGDLDQLCASTEPRWGRLKATCRGMIGGLTPSRRGPPPSTAHQQRVRPLSRDPCITRGTGSPVVRRARAWREPGALHGTGLEHGSGRVDGGRLRDRAADVTERVGILGQAMGGEVALAAAASDARIAAVVSEGAGGRHSRTCRLSNPHSRPQRNRSPTASPTSCPIPDLRSLRSSQLVGSPPDRCF